MELSELAEVHSVVDSLVSLLEARESITQLCAPASDPLPANDPLPEALFQLSLREEKQYLRGEFRELGVVLHFTEGKLVIKSAPSAPLLDLDSSVCGADGLLLGLVDDVLGSVEHPHYSIEAYHRVPDGETVFYPVETAKYLQKISRKPGTDASGQRDEEAALSSGSEGEASPVQRSFEILKRPPASLD